MIADDEPRLVKPGPTETREMSLGGDRNMKALLGVPILAASTTARIGTPRRAFMFLSPPKDISLVSVGPGLTSLGSSSAIIGRCTQRALTGLPILRDLRTQ